MPLREIKRTIGNLRVEYGDWPLTHAHLSVSKGERRVVVTDEHGDYEAGTLKGRFRMDDLQRIATALQRGGWAVRDIPDLEHIEVDPDRLSGRPTIRGRRIAAEDVATIAERPDGEQILKLDYELSPKEIRDARRWWTAVQQYELAS